MSVSLLDYSSMMHETYLEDGNAPLNVLLVFHRFLLLVIPPWKIITMWSSFFAVYYSAERRWRYLYDYGLVVSSVMTC